MIGRFVRRLIVIVPTLLLAGCAAGGRHEFRMPYAGVDPQGRLQILHILRERGMVPPETRQLLLVNQAGAASAMIFAFTEKRGKWVNSLPPMPGTIGRSGFAPPGEKREGDGRTPVGIFRLRRAFGYLPDVPTRMNYRQVTTGDLWIDDVNATDYNRWTQRGETAALSYEELRRADDLYKYGVVIEYNTEPVVSGAGSAIFLHVWQGAGMPTAGCVAVAEQDLLRILGWLDPAQSPVIVMGTEETLRKMALHASG